MKYIKLSLIILFGVLVFSLTSCLDEAEILKREAHEKAMLKAAQIVKAVPPSNLKSIKGINFEACNEALRSKLAHIVDVRDAKSYTKTHIMGAINIPLNSSMFKSNISILNKDKAVLVYGGAKNSSDKAARIMQVLGFKDIYNLENGVEECLSVKIKLSKNNNKENIRIQKLLNTDNANATFIKGIAKASNVGVSEFKNLTNDKVTILDIRPVNEFVTGHIEGALHVDWNAPNFIKDLVNTVPSDKPVLIYGNNGGIDGSNAMAVMQALGFSNISNLEGGIKSYVDAGMKLKELKIEGDPLHLNEDNFQKAIVGELGTIVDVRTMGEFDIAHIPNAVLVDVKKRSFEQQFAKLDKSKPVFIYCRSGVRSMKASKIAKKMGYNVFNLDHGFKGWLKHHKPIIGEAHSIDNGEEGC